MKPPDLYRHCPRCAAPATPGANPFRCPACDLTLFFNPSVAAAGFLHDAAGRCLFIRRAKEPRAGTLAVPGGFVDAGETAEDALRREVREEVGIDIAGVRYLGSCVNRYPYKGVEYPVCDLVFAATAVDPDRASAVETDAVAGVEWLDPRTVDPAGLAFPSLVMGLERLLAGG